MAVTGPNRTLEPAAPVVEVEPEERPVPEPVARLAAAEPEEQELELAAPLVALRAEPLVAVEPEELELAAPLVALAARLVWAAQVAQVARPFAPKSPRVL